MLIPIGQAAKIACEIEALRADCCTAAHRLMQAPVLNECELEECALLDDALAQAQRLLKGSLGQLILSRLRRRSSRKSRS